MLKRPVILILITKADVGGAQVHVLEILKQLKHRFEFILVTGEEDYLTDQARLEQINVRVLKHLKRPISLAEDKRGYGECVALFKALKPDLVHCHSSKAGVIGRLAAWRTNTPALFTAHGWAFTPGVPLIQRLYGFGIEFVLCRAIGHVLTVSKFDYDLAQQYKVGADKRRFLVRNGVVKAHQTANVTRERQNVLQIVSVGRLNEQQKNQSMLIKALALLDFPYHAKIIGDGPSSHIIKNLIVELGVQDKIELVGEVKNVAPHLIQADIFALSSNYEGLPLSILEAMSFGLPVVACDVGGVNEAVIHEKTGLLSERGDVAAFTENIKKMANQPNIMPDYSQQALEYYEQNFTAEKMISELEVVYQELLEKR